MLSFQSFDLISWKEKDPFKLLYDIWLLDIISRKEKERCRYFKSIHSQLWYYFLKGKRSLKIFQIIFQSFEFISEKKMSFENIWICPFRALILFLERKKISVLSFQSFDFTSWQKKDPWKSFHFVLSELWFYFLMAKRSLKIFQSVLLELWFYVLKGKRSLKILDAILSELWSYLL